jgi:hypothetical protein
MDLIEEAGYEGCVSAYGGFIDHGTDPRMLPREAVPWFRSNLNLEIYLSGCLRWFHSLKRRLGLGKKEEKSWQDETQARRGPGSAERPAFTATGAEILNR